jgi:hypothetical protein
MIPSEMRANATVFATPKATAVEQLLGHFRETSPLWLTIGGAERREECLRLIMPATLRSPIVLDCVLTLAAGDLSKYQPANSDMRNLCCGFYGQVVAGIQAALENEFTPSELQTSPAQAGKIRTLQCRTNRRGSSLPRG